MATVKDVLMNMALRFSVDAANMNKELGKISSNMNVFKKGLQTLGKTIAGVFSVYAIANFWKQAYASYQEQYKAEQLLLTSLQGREDIQERLIRQAEYLQKTTIFDDAEIIDIQKTLAGFGASEKQIRDVMDAAVDLATAMGTDLNTAALALWKTYQGNTKELGKYSAEVKGFTPEMLKAGAAVEWVKKNMDGLAETSANTDPITKMKDAWGELAESYGKLVAPLVTKLATTLKKEFTIWGSKDLTIWQKLFQTKGKDELYQQILDQEAALQKLDDAAASTEQTIVKIPPTEAEIEAKVRAANDAIEEQNKQLLELEKQWAVTQSRLDRQIQTGMLNEMFPAQSSINQVYNAPAANAGLKGIDYSKQIQQTQQLAEQMAYLDQMNYMLEASFAELGASVASAFGEMIATGEFGTDQLISVIANMAEQLGKLAISMGVAALGIDKALKTPASGYVAIAAGMALVALAAAVKSSMSNISSGGSGSVSSYQAPTSGGGGGYDFMRQFEQLDKEVVYVEVSGKVEGEALRLIQKRAEIRHRSGY